MYQIGVYWVEQQMSSIRQECMTYPTSGNTVVFSVKVTTRKNPHVGSFNVDVALRGQQYTPLIRGCTSFGQRIVVTADRLYKTVGNFKNMSVHYKVAQYTQDGQRLSPSERGKLCINPKQHEEKQIVMKPNVVKIPSASAISNLFKALQHNGMLQQPSLLPSQPPLQPPPQPTQEVQAHEEARMEAIRFLNALPFEADGTWKVCNSAQFARCETPHQYCPDHYWWNGRPN